MTPEILALTDKARRSLAAARRLIDSGDHDFAVSRAYYAMFYMATALLRSRSRTFSKHSAVIAAFNREFVASGHFTAEHHGWLLDAADARNLGDYRTTPAITEHRARSVLEHATQFVDAAEAWLGRTFG